VRIHLTFLLLVWALFLFTSDPLQALGLIAVIFGCVLLHELGHSLVARGFGLRVADITLWPLGGMARMSEIPEVPRIEALIAIAGPAVNFGLAGLALLGLAAGVALDAQSDLEDFLWFFLVANVMQGGFNLLPAFPMDGGRLLRAFLARKRDWLAATEVAVRVGRVLAGVLFLGSLAFVLRGQGFCMMPLVALFVWLEGKRELWSVRLRHGVSPFGPGARTAWSSSEQAMEEGTGAAPQEPPEPGSARRPRTWLQRLSRSGGFSEDEIRRLESHRGPLRRWIDPM
jgi:Zn-dependent protease